nr:MAG TPA: hypothetical protein [Caudoviricetes sp.]
MSTKGIQTTQLTVNGALNTLYEPVNSIRCIETSVS